MPKKGLASDLRGRPQPQKVRGVHRVPGVRRNLISGSEAHHYDVIKMAVSRRFGTWVDYFIWLEVGNSS